MYAYLSQDIGIQSREQEISPSQFHRRLCSFILFLFNKKGTPIFISFVLFFSPDFIFLSLPLLLGTDRNTGHTHP
jgi:hypothetical protein